MNPLFQSLMGAGTASKVTGGQSSIPVQTGLFGANNGVFQRMQQLAQIMQNPQKLVQQYFPDAPAEVSGDPEQLIGWLQQTGRVNPQAIQMARQMMGR